MLSMIRKRITFANVVLTLALVFVMTGGAYAAKRYLITSTKQISPSVLKSLAGKAGPAGKEGASGKNGTNGSQGPQGSQGSQGVEGKLGKEGKEGEEGEEGREGKEGKEGNTGKEGPQGQPWTPDNTLPAKATETGTWGGRPTEGQIDFVSLSFPVKLAKEIEESNVHIVTVEEQKKENGKEPPAELPGHRGSAHGGTGQPLRLRRDQSLEQYRSQSDL